MEHKHVDLAPLLERAVERFQWAIRDAGIESGIAHRARLPPVHGDARRLEQVFSNLLENAVRHTPRGGVITVTATSLRRRPHQRRRPQHGFAIPKEDLPRVFERFFQVDRARARKGGSSGLGLSIVAEIVEAHGGTVRAISSDTGGTEFLVSCRTRLTSEVRNGRVTEIDDQRPEARHAPGATETRRGPHAGRDATLTPRA